MAGKDYHTNIMLDLECTSVNSTKPVILQLAAVYFDIDTGAELDHMDRVINFDSCKQLGLEDDDDTMDWVRCNIPQTLASSKASRVSLPQALKEFRSFVYQSRVATLKRHNLDASQLKFLQPTIWGNGANADNVWIKSAYRACSMEIPWKFYNDMCVRTFVVQCKMMTGRDFRKEVAFKGVKHKALDDCRHQIEYLVKARNLLKPPPRVERMLPSPETSFSSSNGDVEEAIKSAPARMVSTLNKRIPQDTSPSSKVGEARADQVSKSPSSAERLGAMDGQNTVTNETTQGRGYMYGSDFYSAEGVKQVQVPQWVVSGNRRRRTQPAKVAKQLLTPETSFSAEEYEKEYELGKQEDQRQFGSQC